MYYVPPGGNVFALRNPYPHKNNLRCGPFLVIFHGNILETLKLFIVTEVMEYHSVYVTEHIVTAH
uniref:Uncharacterized protein n=1 Tax=Anguilla anguilla TaxID=7936 RepID=A0A0E9S9G7_ANGAN